MRAGATKIIVCKRVRAIGTKHNGGYPLTSFNRYVHSKPA